MRASREIIPYTTFGPHTRRTSPEFVCSPSGGYLSSLCGELEARHKERRKRNGPGSKSMPTLVRSSSFRSTRDTRREVSERNEQRAKRVWTFDLLSYGLVYLRGVVNQLAKQKYIYRGRWKLDGNTTREKFYSRGESKILKNENRVFSFFFFFRALDRLRFKLTIGNKYG